MLQGPRITLRHVLESDLPLLIRAANDPALRGAFGPSRLASPHQLCKRFAENGHSEEDNERLMVCDERGEIIGDVVHFVERRYSTAREIGWKIHDPARRGQGYASEAAALLVDYLFRSRPIHRIACGMAPGNIASRRVAEKCGFSHEGRTRGILFVDGKYLDGDLFSILRPDWEARRTRA